MKFGIGQPVRRREDVRLVTGRGWYLDDVQVEHAAYAFFVRSPYAHAILRGMDVRAARERPPHSRPRGPFTQMSTATATRISTPVSIC